LQEGTFHPSPLEHVMADMTLPTITVYTDGGCDPNPGAGGWAAILLRPDAEPQELCGAEADTTNNRMELQAALGALLALAEPHQVTLYTDSQYRCQGITEWMPRWEQNNWKRSATKPLANQDLWSELAQAKGRHQIEWKWVKGHAGNAWNERADQLARSMLAPCPLPLEDDKAIHIFTGATCLAAGSGPGGWSATLRFGEKRKVLTGQEKDTTSNRMHLQAATQGLQAVKMALPINLYTTSAYLRDGILCWVKGWHSRGWLTDEGKPVQHRDLWETLQQSASKYEVRYHLVRNPDSPAQMMGAQSLARDAARELAGSDSSPQRG
jgi:ribonuclease HI